jgi:hypothetical protein
VGKHEKSRVRHGRRYIEKGENYERSLKITKTEAKSKENVGNSP